MSSSTDEVARVKQQGNQAFTKGDIVTATELYTRAIELAKAAAGSNVIDPALYSNRAACKLKTAKWQSAVYDCDAGINAFNLLSNDNTVSSSEGVKSKLFFRKATALEAEGYIGLAIRVCEDGVSALAATGKQHQKVLIDFKNRLLSTTATSTNKSVKVAEAKVELLNDGDTFPNDLLSPSELAKLPVSTSRAVNTSKVTPLVAAIKFIPPSLPLTMQSLTQLLRTPPAARSAMHKWFFLHVQPASLPKILGPAGVESELVDLVLDVLITASAAPLENEEQLSRSIAYLEALTACPRFTIARMFCSDSKIHAFISKLLPEQAQRYSTTLSKWK